MQRNLHKYNGEKNATNMFSEYDWKFMLDFHVCDPTVTCACRLARDFVLWTKKTQVTDQGTDTLPQKVRLSWPSWNVWLTLHIQQSENTFELHGSAQSLVLLASRRECSALALVCFAPWMFGTQS